MTSSCGPLIAECHVEAYACYGSLVLSPADIFLNRNENEMGWWLCYYLQFSTMSNLELKDIPNINFDFLLHSLRLAFKFV